MIHLIGNNYDDYFYNRCIFQFFIQTLEIHFYIIHFENQSEVFAEHDEQHIEIMPW